MADATPEELEELGVTLGPERAKFEEISDLPDHPRTDVLIQLDTGEKLRERMTRLPVEEGFSFSFSHALAGDDGSVVQPENGTPAIVPEAARHEFLITGEDMSRMTADQIQKAFDAQREVAAAKARDFFTGMERGAAIFADRLGS